MIEPFQFQLNTRLVFGCGTAGTVAEILTEFKCTRPLLVTEAPLRQAGLLRPVLDSLVAAGLEPSPVFDNVKSEAEISSVKQAIELARSTRCDSVVAVGGGSVMDTAKGINVGLTLGDPLEQHQGLNTLSCKLKLLIAIPTTAGTGSEVSFFASIKDSAALTKMVFGSVYLAPDVALLDPNLLVGLPPAITAATGIDALTHCLESYVAQDSSSPLTMMHCEAALKLLFKFLPRAVANGSDLEAREATLLASTLAGIAFTNTGVGMVHALSHAVSGKFSTHHGATNSVFLVAGMQFNRDVCQQQYAQLARALGISSTENQDDESAANQLIESVRYLLQALKLPAKLKELIGRTIRADEIELLAESASVDPAIIFNPRSCSASHLKTIYESCI